VVGETHPADRITRTAVSTVPIETMILFIHQW
jgi:hypothetical protein